MHPIIYMSVVSFPSERLFRQMADLLVSDGYHAAGYTYINVDDCWLDHRKALIFLEMSNDSINSS